MRSVFLLVAAVLLSSLAVSTMTSSQSTPDSDTTRSSAYGWINGTVTDELNGKPVKSCFVEIAGTTTNTLTDDKGSFSLQVIAADRFEVRAKKTSYDDGNAVAGNVAPGGTFVLDLTLLKNVANLYITFKGGGTIGGNAAGIVRIVDDIDPSKFDKEYNIANPITFWQLDVPAPAIYNITGRVPDLGTGTIVEKVTVDRGQYLTVLLDVDELETQAGKLIISTSYRNGSAISGVSVTIVYQSFKGSNTTYVRTTDPNGVCVFEGQTGRYNITVTMDGFVEEKRMIDMAGLGEIPVDFTMLEDPGAPDNNASLIIVMSAVIAILFILMVVSAIVIIGIRRKRARDKALGEDEYVCPECGTVVDDKAVACPKCSFKFPWKQFRCPECGELLEFNARKCTQCGNMEFEMR